MIVFFQEAILYVWLSKEVFYFSASMKNMAGSKSEKSTDSLFWREKIFQQYFYVVLAIENDRRGQLGDAAAFGKIEKQ